MWQFCGLPTESSNTHRGSSVLSPRTDFDLDPSSGSSSVGNQGSSELYIFLRDQDTQTTSAPSWSVKSAELILGKGVLGS